MRILDVNEKVLVKKYIRIEVKGREYVVYICNDVVAGIYEQMSNGVSVSTGNKALCSLTGRTMKSFMEEVNQWIE